MIPAGVFNQSSLSDNPIWYLDFRPTNSAKPLTGSMGPEWHTVNVPFDQYNAVSGYFGIGVTTAPISVLMENLSPINGDEEIDVAVLSQDVGGGFYAMAGYMLDPITGSVFNRSRERSLVFGDVTDNISIDFLNAGTYKMYINANIPSDLLPVFTSVWENTIYNDSNVIQGSYEVSFNAVDRILTSSALNDPGWYTNDVGGECVFTVGAGWSVALSSVVSGAESGAIIGQIAIEKID